MRDAVEAVWLVAAGLIGIAVVGFILAIMIGGTVNYIKKKRKEGRGHDDN